MFYSHPNFGKAIPSGIRVELRKNEIDLSSEDSIPVKVLERENPTEQQNGTFIEIEDINLQKIDKKSIIKYVEHQISKWKNASVYVDNHDKIVAYVRNKVHWRMIDILKKSSKEFVNINDIKKKIPPL